MYRIGEFEKLTGISSRMLRYYDKVGLLKPIHLDQATSYRFYSITQMETANKVKYLRNSGFTIEEVINLIQLEEIELKEQLANKKEELLQEISSQQEMINNIDTLMSKEELKFVYEVIYKEIPDYNILSLRKTIKKYEDEHNLWMELFSFISTNDLEITQPIYAFTIYHDIGYKEKDVDIEIAVCVDKMNKSKNEFNYKTIKGYPRMASIYVYGEYENISLLYSSFTQWLAKQNEYDIIGEIRQVVHKGAWNTNNPEEYLIELQIPVQKIEAETF